MARISILVAVYLLCLTMLPWRGITCCRPCTGISCVIGCSAPKDYPNRYIQVVAPSRCDYAIGSIVWYTCQQGSEHEVEHAYSRCQKNGTWSMPDMTCSPVCGLPLKISHAVHDSGTNGHHVGSEVTYQCEDGYSSPGNSVMKMKCREYVNAEWDTITETISCQKMCRAFHVENGEVLPENTLHMVPFNTTKQVTCQPGFCLHGPDSRTCSHEGQWTGYYPQCTEIRCPWLYDPINGYIVDKKNTLGSRIEYRCNKGYELISDSERRCMQVGGNGYWSGTEGRCQRKDCGMPYFPFGTCDTSKGTSYMDIVTCRCNADANKAFSLFCNWEGKWRPDFEHECPRDCSVQLGLDTFIIEHRATMSCVCKPGENVLCRNGSLIQGTGCFPKCDLPWPVIENGHFEIPVKMQWEIRFNLSCNDGYSMNGSETSRCVCPGVWSPPLPNCVEENDGIKTKEIQLDGEDRISDVNDKQSMSNKPSIIIGVHR